MADYSGECFRWADSSDIDCGGRRWCPYSRRCEEACQNADGCLGFAYGGCSILIKLCEFLNEPKEEGVKAFEALKVVFAAPEYAEWLSAYYSLYPRIADRLGADVQRGQAADELMREYIKPAYAFWQEGNYEQSAKQYMEMIAYLANRYLCS